MGNTLAPMQQQLVAIGTPAGDDAREILDRLEDMAQDRIDLFYDRIGHEDNDRHLIPINKVLNKYTYIGISAQTNADVWPVEVKGAVSEFSIGPVAEGLALVATKTILKMTNAGAGRRQIEQRYAISLDALGGISRLDYFIFTYSFSSSELVKKRASLVACCVVESSAVVKDLDANTLRVIISRTFKGGDVPHFILTAIYSQLILAITGPLTAIVLSKQEKDDLAEWYKTDSKHKAVRKQSDTSNSAGGTSPDEPLNNGASKPAEVPV
ncbi:hypothetical protein BDM02DRAFT_3125842 [Thelephora ganbajun]|uniref:Uncharacterized protein n=1 Tax=Thelephora ganbajun TaxID=370292 RepID=A0ACB6ZVM1_THEGA|nr:hypothetical protein BDM02DRAFT_3125842 [Thelephora ganbajun]